MSTITLQTTNISVKTKKKAEKRAQSEGYSSIHEVIRLFLHDYAYGKPLRVAWGAALDPEVQKALRDYERGEYTEVKPGELLSEKLLD